MNLCEQTAARRLGEPAPLERSVINYLCGLGVSIDEIVSYIWRGRLLAQKKNLERLIGMELCPGDFEAAVDQLMSGKDLAAVAAYFKNIYGIS